MKQKEKLILYIHGMGGGGDSRIPSILNEYFRSKTRWRIDVIVRTYDFNPEVAAHQIANWVEELRPSLIIGESLGACHAISICGIPHILVSPSLNAPLFFYYLAFCSFVPGIRKILNKIYAPKSGDRQKIDFTFGKLSKWKKCRDLSLCNSVKNGSKDYFFAFFGRKDHYRRSGIVSLHTYRKYFGDSFALYDGTHFMEEDFLISMLIPKILRLLGFIS